MHEQEGSGTKGHPAVAGLTHWRLTFTSTLPAHIICWKFDLNQNFGTNSIFEKTEENVLGVFTRVFFVSWVLLKGHLAIEQRGWPRSSTGKAGQRNRLTTTPLACSFHPLQWAFSPQFVRTPSFHSPLIMILVLPFALLPLVLAMPSQVAKKATIRWCLNLFVCA